MATTMHKTHVKATILALLITHVKTSKPPFNYGPISESPRTDTQVCPYHCYGKHI
jgi:hypothetical protein